MRYAIGIMAAVAKQFKVFLQVFLLFFLSLCFCLILSSCAARMAPAKETKSDFEQTFVTNEVLEDIHVRVPESIKLDDSFELRITTIGSMGTKPFFEDGDVLELSFESSVGRLEPAEAKLQEGIGTLELTLTAVDNTAKSAEITVILKDLNQNLISKIITLNIQ